MPACWLVIIISSIMRFSYKYLEKPDFSYRYLYGWWHTGPRSSTRWVDWKPPSSRGTHRGKRYRYICTYILINGSLRLIIIYHIWYRLETRVRTCRLGTLPAYSKRCYVRTKNTQTSRIPMKWNWQHKEPSTRTPSYKKAEKHCFIAALPYCFICFIASLLHCFIASLLHLFTGSFSWPQCFMASWLFWTWGENERYSF